MNGATGLPAEYGRFLTEESMAWILTTFRLLKSRRGRWWGIGLVVVLLHALGTVAVLAADTKGARPPRHNCYTLLRKELADGSFGKPQPFCIELTRNLNEFCGSAPHVCSIPLSPKYPKLSEPQWRPLSAVDHFYLIEDLVRGTWLPNRETDPEGYARVVKETLSGYKEALDSGHLELYEATFDFGGFGAEPFYRIETGRCQAELSEWKRNPRVRGMRDRFGPDYPLTETTKNVRATMLAQVDPLLYPRRAAEVAQGIRPLSKTQALARPSFEGRNQSGLLGTPILYARRVFYVQWTVGSDALDVIGPADGHPQGAAQGLCSIRFNFPGQRID